jgi:tetratricopeptide (TPR) repeat protein
MSRSRKGRDRKPGSAEPTPPPRGRGRSPGRGARAIAAAALAAFVLYLPALGGGFVWDDHLLIEQNPLLRSTAGLARALLGDFWAASSGAHSSGLWRPLITLSYGVDGALSHWTPGWFHAMNALAHALASALVTALALGAGLPALAAGLAGLLFAAMPAHLESVAWISGRTDVYCAVFFLLALLLDRRARAAGRSWPGVAPLVALALALLGKETALPFVAVVAVAERIGVRGRAPELRASAGWLAPYAAVTALHLIVHQAWVRVPEAPGTAAAGVQGLRAVALMFPGYLAFAWPWFPHTPAVLLSPASASALALAGAVALHAGFVVALGWLLWRRSAAALPLALFWLTLLPTLVVNLGRGTFLYSERFLYLPSAGLAWAAAAGVEALRARPRAWRAGVVGLTVLVLGSAAVLVPRIAEWHDDSALFAAMARRSPRNYMARTQWARMLALAGRDAESARELDAARALDPSRPEEPSIRALLAYRRGDWPETLAQAERAMAQGNAENEPRLLRATALLATGRMDEGRSALEELRRRTPGQPAVESLWGQYLLNTGRAAEAYPVLAQASLLLPDDPSLALALGLAANDTGRRAEARAALERAVRLAPGSYEAWLELARTLAASGDAPGAAAALASAGRLPAAADGRAAAMRAQLPAGR